MLTPATLFIDVIFSACFSVYLVEVIRLHKLAKFPPSRYKRSKAVLKGPYSRYGLSIAWAVIRFNLGRLFNRKPLTCAVCLSAWVGLVIGLLKYSLPYPLYPMFIAGIAGLLLTRILYKL